MSPDLFHVFYIKSHKPRHGNSKSVATSMKFDFLIQAKRKLGCPTVPKAQITKTTECPSARALGGEDLEVNTVLSVSRADN